MGEKGIVDPGSGSASPYGAQPDPSAPTQGAGGSSGGSGGGGSTPDTGGSTPQNA
jgi:hypothetical protein